MAQTTVLHLVTGLMHTIGTWQGPSTRQLQGMERITSVVETVLYNISSLRNYCDQENWIFILDG